MAWTQSGNIRGPQGPEGQRGPAGERGVEGPEGPQGIQGPEGQRGPAGEQGRAGQDGKSLSITGTVATYGELPEDLEPSDAGKGYVVASTGRLYIWSGSAFPIEAEGVEIRGPEGPAGGQGPAGRDGQQGPQGERGPAGGQGPEGPGGETGQRGSKWFTGSGVPTSVPDSAVGDHYLDMTSGNVYELR